MSALNRLTMDTIIGPEEYQELQGNLEYLIEHVKDAPTKKKLQDLQDAVIEGEEAQLRRFSTIDLYSAFDLSDIKERITQSGCLNWTLSAMEWARNILVLIPILITWYALAQASANYQVAVNRDPSLLSQPFLLLWQNGFGNPDRISSPRFSDIATVDAGILLIVVVLSAIVHIHWGNLRRKQSHRLEKTIWACNKILSEYRFATTEEGRLEEFVNSATVLSSSLQREQNRVNELAEWRDHELNLLRAFGNDFREGASYVVGVVESNGHLLNQLREMQLSMNTIGEDLINLRENNQLYSETVFLNLSSFQGVVLDLNNGIDHAVRRLEDATTQNAQSAARSTQIAAQVSDLFQSVLDNQQHISEIVQESAQQSRELTQTFRDLSENILRLERELDESADSAQELGQEWRNLQQTLSNLIGRIERANEYQERITSEAIHSIQVTTSSNMQSIQGIVSQSTKTLEKVYKETEQRLRSAERQVMQSGYSRTATMLTLGLLTIAGCGIGSLIMYIFLS